MLAPRTGCRPTCPAGEQGGERDEAQRQKYTHTRTHTYKRWTEIRGQRPLGRGTTMESLKKQNKKKQGVGLNDSKQAAAFISCKCASSWRAERRAGGGVIIVSKLRCSNRPDTYQPRSEHFGEVRGGQRIGNCWLPTTPPPPHNNKEGPKNTKSVPVR